MYREYRVNPDRALTALHKAGFKTWAEFSRAARIHRNTLEQYLSGRKLVLPVAVQRMAEKLDVDPMELVYSAGAVDDEVDIRLLRRFLNPIAEQFPNVAFMLIGSRARGNARSRSDFDIALSMGEQPLSSREYLRVRSSIEDALEDFPRSVDIVNLDQAPLWFLADLNYAPVFVTGKQDSFKYLLGVVDGIRKTRAHSASHRES